MNKTQILSNNTNGTQPICIYRCQKHNLYLFYGYVNISMCQSCFTQMCRSIFDIHAKIENGEINTSHITVNYSSTTLVLPIDDFCIVSQCLANAQERLEFIEDCDLAGVSPTTKELDTIDQAYNATFSHINHHANHSHLN